eukprot:Skav214121  [mRNA]  locus=scaffold1185:541333:543390:- [translate_table: standard]
MAKAKLQPNIYSFNAAISSSEKSSLWWQALDVLTTAPKLPVQRNVVNFNATICACNQPLVDKKDLWKMGVGLLDTIMSTDLQPSVISYSTMASEAPWELSFACLESMAWSSIESNAFSFSTAVSTGELWQVSLQLLQDMPQQQLEPNLVCYNALSLLDLMEEKGLQPDLLTFNSVMHACQMAEAWQVAFHILSAMRESQVKPGADSYDIAMRRWSL